MAASSRNSSRHACRLRPGDTIHQSKQGYTCAVQAPGQSNQGSERLPATTREADTCPVGRLNDEHTGARSTSVADQWLLRASERCEKDC